jgi:hypothetical protein
VGPRAGLDGWSVEEAADITDHREKNRPTACNIENKVRNKEVFYLTKLSNCSYHTVWVANE